MTLSDGSGEVVDIADLAGRGPLHSFCPCCIKDLFSISEGDQREIQATCSSLEENMSGLTQCTEALENTVQELSLTISKNTQEVNRLLQREKVLSDKLERIENNSRRNNSRILDVAKGVKGANIELFVIYLLTKAFPKETSCVNLGAEIKKDDPDLFKLKPG
ncbi:hypothetical protein NDU88_005311 [Pleurodeles waltl]|uniref:Uncharacterized protein n=1 Tax=Pleurodeles waltl TaxID=8319 RepID=A0AAV7SL98_PLEWA|nr:hypothetical protein NDU88_005311 [Pleurodeles waltl]